MKYQNGYTTINLPDPIGWGTEAEWELEVRAFNAANDTNLPDHIRVLIRDLWMQYCLAAVSMEK
jgi:hypothetical protein